MAAMHNFHVVHNSNYDGDGDGDGDGDDDDDDDADDVFHNFDTCHFIV